jgi:hypothetical protein
MTTLRIKGHDINILPVRDTFIRRAAQYRNKIYAAFKSIGIPAESGVEIPEENAPMRKAAASVSWYDDGTHCHYSYGRGSNYAENLQVIMRVLEQEIAAVVEGKKAREQFINDYAEDKDVAGQRAKARMTLGVEEDCTDTKRIDSHYKKLAKEKHPDMPGGSTEAFKKINAAHKVLKRELE